MMFRFMVRPNGSSSFGLWIIFFIYSKCWFSVQLVKKIKLSTKLLKKKEQHWQLPAILRQVHEFYLSAVVDTFDGLVVDVPLIDGLLYVVDCTRCGPVCTSSNVKCESSEKQFCLNMPKHAQENALLNSIGRPKSYLVRTCLNMLNHAHQPHILLFFYCLFSMVKTVYNECPELERYVLSDGG